MAAVAIYCTDDDEPASSADFRDVVARKFAGLQTILSIQLSKACEQLMSEYQGAETVNGFHSSPVSPPNEKNDNHLGAGLPGPPVPLTLNGSGWDLPAMRSPRDAMPSPTEKTPAQGMARQPFKAGATCGIYTPPLPEEPDVDHYMSDAEVTKLATGTEAEPLVDDLETHLHSSKTRRTSYHQKLQTRYTWNQEWQSLESSVRGHSCENDSDSEHSGYFHFPRHATHASLHRQKHVSLFLEWDAQFSQMSKLYCQRIIVNPLSMKRLAWDMTGLIFLCWDLFTIPLEFFEPEETGVIMVMFWACVTYWTLDILGSFLTGIVGQTYLEMRPSQIAKAYVSSWFIFDVAVLSPDWIRVILSTDTGSFMRLGKTMKSVRVLRTLRLLRMAKMQRILMLFQQRINSEHFLSYFSLVKLIICLTVMSHYFACGFYAVGISGGDTGWVAKYKMRDAPLEYRYFTSFQWALTQIQGSIDLYPGTTSERIFAVINLVVAIIVVGGFIGWISNFMIELQKLKSDEMQRHWELTRYLHDRQISSELSVRIKHWFTNLAETRKAMADRKLMDTLPEQMRLDLEHEIKGPGLTMHPLLCVLMSKQEHMAEQLCFIAVEVLLRRGELLFRRGQPCSCIYLFTRGRLMYGSNLRKNNRAMFQLIVETDKAGANKQKFKMPSGLGGRMCTQMGLNWDPASPTSTSPTTPNHSASTNEDLGAKSSASGLSTGTAIPEVEAVDARTWLSEMGLWTRWANRGDAVAVAQQISQAFTLSSQDLAALVSDNLEYVERVLRYGHTYMHWMNQQDSQRLTDLSGGTMITSSFIDTTI